MIWALLLPSSASLGWWRDCKEIQVLEQAEAGDPMAVNLGSCTSSGWAAESCHHHGMGSPVLSCLWLPGRASSTDLAWAAPSQPSAVASCTQGNKSRRRIALMEQAQPLSCRAGKSGTSKGSFAFLQMPQCKCSDRVAQSTLIISKAFFSFYCKTN